MGLKRGLYAAIGPKAFLRRFLSNSFSYKHDTISGSVKWYVTPVESRTVKHALAYFNPIFNYQDGADALFN